MNIDIDKWNLTKRTKFITYKESETIHWKTKARLFESLCASIRCVSFTRVIDRVKLHLYAFVIELNRSKLRSKTSPGTASFVRKPIAGETRRFPCVVVLDD